MHSLARLTRRLATLLTAALIVTAVSSTAVAQSSDARITDGFALPDPSVTTVDDLTAANLNPAGLGGVQGGEMAYGLGLLAPPTERQLSTEHSLMAAAGGNGFGAGLALQWLEQEFGGRSIRYHKHSIGLGFDATSMMSVGTAVHFFGSPDSRAIDDLTTFDVGLQLRPTSFLGLGLVARDVNQPFASSFESIPLSLRPGLALRFLDGRLVADGELDWTPRTGRTVVHPRLNVEPIRGLRLFARGGMPLGDQNEGDLTDGWTLSGGVAINLGYAGVRSGVYAEKRPRSAHLTRQSHLIRATTERESSLIPYGGRWIRMPIDSSLGERSERPLFGAEQRSLLEVQRTMRTIGNDPEIDGIILDIKPNDLGFAQAWELRQSIRQLRDADTHVVALLQAPDTTNSYLAAAADQTWLLPAEPYEPAGLSTNRLHYAELLDDIGIRAEFIRIGDYKSAPESFVRESPSEASLRQTNAYLDQLFESIVDGLSDGLNKSGDAIREMIDSVPHLPHRAVERGFVDDVVYPDEVHAKLRDTYDAVASIDDSYVTASTGNERWNSPAEIAVIHIDGSIIRGQSGRAPLIGQTVTGHKTIRNTVNTLIAAPDVRAAVVRIDSPGGSAVASDLIYRDIRRLASQMPVVASMGDVAASGGYYVAAGADTIFATPTTLTGSIGIFAGKFSLGSLADRVGINSRQLQRGETAGNLSPFRPWTSDEKQAVTTSMNYLYELFLEQAAQTRPLDTGELDELARGRVWVGTDAADKKLVDNLGSLTDALRRAERLAELEPGQARYQSYPAEQSLPSVSAGLTAMLRHILENNRSQPSLESAGRDLLDQLSDMALLPLLYGQREPVMLPYAPIRVQ